MYYNLTAKKSEVLDICYVIWCAQDCVSIRVRLKKQVENGPKIK